MTTKAALAGITPERLAYLERLEATQENIMAREQRFVAANLPFPIKLVTNKAEAALFGDVQEVLLLGTLTRRNGELVFATTHTYGVFTSDCVDEMLEEGWYFATV